MLVAPFYGVDQDGTRAGFRPEFVQNIRRCLYPQFAWDQLPVKGSSESILMFNQIQSVGKHHESIDVTDYCLTEDAMKIIDERLTWHSTGLLFENGPVNDFRKSIEALF